MFYILHGANFKNIHTNVKKKRHKRIQLIIVISEQWGDIYMVSNLFLYSFLDFLYYMCIL